jgi:uncharacterized protein YpbB/energy-coupling factor transporter ATP-binding protein EcfA2
MEYRENEQLKLASEFVQFTNRNVFLTGKAGTGKTTFLHHLKKITPKRMVVVAPTGVAAINAGGVTIHSFFQLSFAPAVPAFAQTRNTFNDKEGYKRKFSREKIRLIKCIDLLVIDEISMVRADILDSVDEVLRKYRNRSKPFGGVQLLMIGDLHQLSPVIKDDEWAILRDYYPSVYFFDSHALKNSNPISIELKEIFRQSDKYFIDLLNKVRDNKTDAQTISEINTRYIPGFKHKDDEGYITLTTHNAFAADMNRAKLEEIKTTPHFFTADITGDFPPHDFPNEDKLELKTGAQVMFIRNDSAAERKYYNGKIGKITRIEDDLVYVQCPGESYEIEVGKVEWENVKYSLNDTTKEINEDVVGTFMQLPLKLAWAITIHKSQGLTFEKVIIDANAAFAYGQVYVALSRCRTFEGIVLSTPISISGIKTDSLVLNYSDSTRQNEPGPENLLESKRLFQQDLIFELFDFKLIRYRFDELIKLTTEHSRVLDPGMIMEIQAKKKLFDSEIMQISEKFRQQLTQLMLTEQMPEETPDLQARLKKATAYFLANIKMHLTELLDNLIFDPDNKAIKKDLNESLEKFQKEVFIKFQCLKNSTDGFDTVSYIRKRSDAEVDFRPTLKTKTKGLLKVPKTIQHPDLYIELKQWRDNLAEENNVPVFHILPQKTLLEILDKLPTTLPELRTIKGMGQIKVQQFGDDILGLIKEYCIFNDIVPEKIEIPVKKKKEKKDTKLISFELFQSGKTVGEIAMERSVTTSTVEGHLAYYVGLGKLDVTELVSEEKLQKVLHIINENPQKPLSEIKNTFGDALSYGELMLIIQHNLWMQKV